MTSIDVGHLRRWVGRSRSDEDVIAARHARLMAATVDYFASERIREGENLPALWHWLYFLEGVPARELGGDGHPARGDFLPPVPLPNRMWAGGRVHFAAPVPIGSTARRISTVTSVEHKQGRTGDLVFVTVSHAIESLTGAALVREEHDIVYRNPSPPIAASKRTVGTASAAEGAADASARTDAAMSAEFTRRFTPTSTTLFRYSALTFNGHRIHYDADYCRDVEGYPNLVVHGPLVATLLANLAEEVNGTPLREFRYRAQAPAFLGATLTLAGERREGGLAVRAMTDDGRILMQADAIIG
jgi:3-methylfumaryl-CoA hydratase